jgi:hypothetical protein
MESSDNRFKLEREDAVQISVDGEYMVSKAVAVRLRYYYDPASVPDKH